MKIILLSLIFSLTLFLSANEKIEYKKMIKELNDKVFDFGYQEYEEDKKKLDNLIESIDLNDNKLLLEIQELKNELFISSVFFKNKKGTLIALNLGAEINFNYKISPLTIAAINKDLETAEVLIDYGININKEDQSGYSPIFWSIYSNSETIFYFLEKNGGDISTVLKNGKTPVQATIEAENIKILEYLLKKNVYVQDEYKKELKNKKLENKKVLRVLKKYKIE